MSIEARVLRTSSYLHRNERDTRLHQLIVAFSEAQCTDARDRIYSFISIEPRYSISADYASSVEDVYIAFARKVLARREFWILLLAAHTQDESRLPSWVPDLRKTSPKDLASETGWHEDTGHVIVEDKKLLLTAYFIGFVASVSFAEVDLMVILPDGLENLSSQYSLLLDGLHVETKGCPDKDVEPGDSLFAVTHEVWHKAVLWLRPLDNTASTFRLIGACSVSLPIFPYLHELRHFRPKASSKQTIIII